MFKYKSLTPLTKNILVDKATEPSFSGKYINVMQHGTYLCRGCGAVLFRSHGQFLSSCGWPSFDDEIPNAILKQPDADGKRVEILCNQCHGHLGHVFAGEGYTEKNTRHCVNSLAIEFVLNETVLHTDEAIVAGGCFWGVQHLFDQLKGVLLTEVGYIGGHTDLPTYQSVCSHQTGHVEALRVVFDTDVVSYEAVIKYFFEIHDASQVNGQGPDVGNQYLSRIFYFNEAQKNTAQSVINLLNKKMKVSTQILPVSVFWPAEEYHQEYYRKNQKAPYCHVYTKRF